MRFPDWFDQLPTFRTRDPLAALLGSADDGVFEYRYADAVRLCGHSCPTVASAWLMASHGLQALWGDELPVRGAVSVAFAEARDSGVTGVTAAVFTLLSGAADEAGFKGLGGRFDRRLARFSAAIPCRVRLTRLDDGRAVEVDADVSAIPPDPALGGLIGQVVAGRASPEQEAEFGRVWQDRVRRILLAGQEVVRISAVR